MMDIVERLRNNCSCNIDSTPCGAEEQCRNAYEAADEIERLRLGNRLHLELAEIKEAEIERLRNILKNVFEQIPEHIPFGIMKDIRDALKEKE